MGDACERGGVALVSVLITHVFRSDDPYLDSDAVFGVRQSLVADWKKQPDGTCLVEYDFVLNLAR